MTYIKKIFLLLFVCFLVSPSFAYCEEDIKLTPSGNVVEMFITLKNPYVYSCIDGSKKKLEMYDIIVCIEHEGRKITTFENMYDLMKLSNEKVKVTYIRKGREKNIKMTTDDLRSYKLTNNMACAGTMTAIDELGNYVALSHDIKLNDSKISIDKGVVVETTYVQERKSKDGDVGHLITTSSNEKIGTVNTMTKYGLQGKCTNFNYDPDKAFEIAKPKCGKAYIYCETPITNKIEFHEIEILEVEDKSSKIQIKDKDLLSIRGGGVQGMSGSPVIQDGKIVGGFSHVYRNNTSTGLIANIQSMLETAQNDK